MVDITHKITSLRQAIAEATVRVSQLSTIEAIAQGRVPKGDVLQTARVAGLFAAKKTADMIPDCHPLPIEFAQIDYEIIGLEIKINVEIRTIYRTGVEVEAMHAASVVALTIYDMLKPIDSQIAIQNIALKSKKGGKSQQQKQWQNQSVSLSAPIRCAVIVCSDSAASGQKKDSSGQFLVDKISSWQAENKAEKANESPRIELAQYLICPDEIAKIQTSVLALCLQDIDLILLTGGTGLAARDVSPEAVTPLFERQIDGIAEAFRAYSQERMPTAMLSRMVAGLRGSTLIIALPGSIGAVTDAINVLFPYVFHIFDLLRQTPAAKHLS
jgi:molybdenum cofactor biosynthesis protein MoaC